MRKYPKNVWSIHPLLSGIETKKELDEQEKLLIRALKAQHPDVGYNIGSGGESAPCGNTHGRGNRGRVMSETWRRRLKEAAIRRFASAQERVKHSAAHKGKSMPPRSEAHCRHLSEALMGHHPSADQILHQSLAQKGRPKPPRTEEHIRNNADAVRAYWAAQKAAKP